MRLLSLAAAILCIPIARAGIHADFGDVTILDSAPADLSLDAYPTDGHAIAFAERRDVALPFDISIDITDSGKNWKAGMVEGGMLRAGTIVNSYLVHADATGKNFRYFNFGLSVDEKVLAIITSDGKVMNTHAILGTLGTTYEYTLDATLGLEISQGVPGDQIGLERNRHHIAAELTVRPGIDEFRILTEGTVPEPGAFAGFTMTGMLFIARKRQPAP